MKLKKHVEKVKENKLEKQYQRTLLKVFRKMFDTIRQDLLDSLPEDERVDLLSARSKRQQFASLGGKAKGKKKYAAFVQWINEKEFDILKYKDVSNLNFARAVNENGFSISEWTAAKYRKKFLSEIVGQPLAS
jgi:hypothetical protein